MLAASLAAAAGAAAKPAPNFDVYQGDVARDALSKIAALGIDRAEIDLSAAKAGGEGRGDGQPPGGGGRARRGGPAARRRGGAAAAQGERGPARRAAREEAGRGRLELVQRRRRQGRHEGGVQSEEHPSECTPPS